MTYNSVARQGFEGERGERDEFLTKIAKQQDEPRSECCSNDLNLKRLSQRTSLRKTRPPPIHN